MVSVIDKARRQAKKALEMLYEDTCIISSYGKRTDSKTHLTSSEPVMICKDQPCKLSFENQPASSESRTVDTTSQSIRLFLPPDIVVQAGCEISVMHKGVTTAYKNSGKPAIYTTHQEINLELKAVHP